jgi:sec-independent protein translocase protein TatA
MPNLRPVEILLIVLVVLLLFGARRLPDLARSVGRSLKIFKSEVKDLRDDDGPATAPSALTDSRPDGDPRLAPRPDAHTTGTTPPHGDPTRDALPTDPVDRKQV